MSKNTPNTDTRPLECELYIVHDKKTKPIAVGIYNKLHSKCKCAHWDEETYAYNENRATNANRFLFLSEKLIEENLAIEFTSEKKLADNVTLVSAGNMFGIKAYVNSAPLITISDWWKFLLGVVHWGFLVAYWIAPYLKIKNKTERTRYKLIMEGALYLIKDDNYKLIIKD